MRGVEKLYENIRKYRLKAGMSQTELAKSIGYGDRSAVSRIEAGQIDLPYSKVLRIAETLDVDPVILMGLDTTVVALAALENFTASLRARKGGDER